MRVIHLRIAHILLRPKRTYVRNHRLHPSHSQADSSVEHQKRERCEQQRVLCELARCNPVAYCSSNMFFFILTAHPASDASHLIPAIDVEAIRTVNPQVNPTVYPG